ncbi:MAG: hypothetical protein U0031_12005 [Thermomicrobiales bacterium]
MNAPRLTRRFFLSALAATFATHSRVAAEGQDFADDIASGAQMKGICEENGGNFTDTEDGNLWCQWGDGSQTVCDTDGKDCYDILARRFPTGEDSWNLPLVPITTVNGTSPAEDQSSATPSSGNEHQDRQTHNGHGKGKSAKGKKGGRRGNGRR